MMNLNESMLPLLLSAFMDKYASPPTLLCIDRYIQSNPLSRPLLLHIEIRTPQNRQKSVGFVGFCRQMFMSLRGRE